MVYILNKMVQKNNPKKLVPKKGSKHWSNKNGPKSCAIVQESKGPRVQGSIFPIDLNAQRTCAVNLQQSRDLVGVKEFLEDKRALNNLWINLVHIAESRKTFRGLHRDEGMFMHFTLQGENQPSVAK